MNVAGCIAGQSASSWLTSSSLDSGLHGGVGGRSYGKSQVRRWVRDVEVQIIFEAAIEVAASQSQDGVGAAHSPEHARLLAAGTDDGFAACFDDAGADEQMLRAEFRVAHALGVFLKVVGLDADLFGQLGIGRIDGTERGHQTFNLPLIQQRVLMDEYPAFLLGLLVGIQLAGQSQRCCRA